MPVKPLSLTDSGLTFVFPAALLAPPELEALGLPVPEAELAVLEVPLPLEVPDATSDWPGVGKAALGSTFQPVGVGVGQAGGVNPEAEAAYAEEAIPVG